MSEIPHLREMAQDLRKIVKKVKAKLWRPPFRWKLIFQDLGECSL